MKNNSITTFDVSSATFFRAILFALGLWFLWVIRDILMILLVSVFIASALEPLASRLQRFKIPRAISVLAVYLVFVLALIGVGILVVPPLVSEIQKLTQDLPALFEHLNTILGRTGFVFNSDTTLSTLQKSLGNAGEFLTQTSSGIFATTRSVFTAVFSVFLTLVISLYLVISRDSLYQFIRSVVPDEHQPYVIQVLKRSQDKIGRWLIAQTILGFIVGLLVFLGLWALNIPYALALALLAFFAEFVPVIGPTFAAIPAAFIGFTHSFLLGIVVIVMYIILQQVEAHVFVPTIMRRAVGLNPIVTIIAVLVGARLAGLVGVLIAVPLATIIVSFLSDLIRGNKEEELPA